MKSRDTLIAELNVRLRDKTNALVESGDAQNFLNEAIRFLKSTHNMPGSKQRATMSLFQNVNEYPAPSGYKETIDFRSDTQVVEAERVTSASFWHDTAHRSFVYADDNYNETRVLLVSASSAAGEVILHTMDSLTDDGTWAAVAGSLASNLTADSVDFKLGAASINFDVAAATVPAIDNTLGTAVDLSDHEDKATLFAWVYLPTITDLTSVELWWGNDSSNYFSVTNANQFNDQALVVGWNLIDFAWNGATETGTVTTTAIDYLRVTINYSVATTDTDFRVDQIRSILPDKYTHNFYSKNFVKDNAGAYQEEFSAGDDTTVLEDWQDELLLTKAEERAWLYLREPDQAVRARNEFQVLFGSIKSDEPDESSSPSDYYYY